MGGHIKYNVYDFNINRYEQWNEIGKASHYPGTPSIQKGFYILMKNNLIYAPA